MKNIIFVIPTMVVGGTEQHLVDLLPQLASEGFFVRVLTLYGKGELASFLEDKNVSVTPMLSSWWHKKNGSFFLRFIRKLFRTCFCIVKLRYFLRQEKSAIVHFFLPEAYIIGMFSAKLAQFCGSIIMSRRSLNDYQNKYLAVKWFEKRLHARTSFITGNSQAVIAQLSDEGVPSNRLTLIYNGVNLSSFRSVNTGEKIRRSLNISNHSLMLILVANLIPYKGHQDLLLALGSIKDYLPRDWCLICVGRDDGIGSLLMTAAELNGLSNHIQWLGSRNDVPDLLMASDISILCSHEEGFSNAILEGMAAGLPMVVTDVGGNKEAVIDGETGFVVPAKNPDALGQAILKLANDPSLAKQFGLAGQKRVKEHFSLEASVNAYVQLYEECLFGTASKSSKSTGSVCVD